MSTVKLTFNTNMQSLLVQNNLKRSTNKLNQAIERLTTGAKINHASDNAANYSIVNNLDTKISAYKVAEDNAMQGLDMLNTTGSSLDLIESNLNRLRVLQEQSMNGTYGESSLDAINLEANSIIDTIEDVYKNTEYNGISLLLTKYTTETSTADEDTTFEQLGIGDSSFSIYDSDGVELGSYTTTAENSIGDFLEELRTNHNFNAEILDGKITLNSPDYHYVGGALANALGITNSTISVISQSTQYSTAQATYTVTTKATNTSTFSQLGVLQSGTATVTVKSSDGTVAGTINISPDMDLDTFFDRLSGFYITGNVDDGVITLNSAVGNYLDSRGVISSLGISAYVSSTNTIGATQTSTLPIIRTETITTPQRTETISTEVTRTVWTTTTTSETHTETIYTTTTTTTTLTETIYTTTTTTTTSTETIWTTTTTTTTSTETICTTTTTGSTQTLTIGTTQTSSSPITYATGTTTIVATESSLISDFVTLSYGYSTNTLMIYSEAADIVYYTVYSTTTFGDLFTALNSAGITTTLDSYNGQLQFSNPTDAFIVSAFGDDNIYNRLGLNDTVYDTLKTVGTQGTVNAPVLNGFLEDVTTLSTAGCIDLNGISTSSTLASGSYKITDKQGLINLATLANSYKLTSSNTYTFILDSDIDLTGENWTPIGKSSSYKFIGTFEGNGHKISNITIYDSSNIAYLGLFGYVYRGTIKNLAVEDVNINYDCTDDMWKHCTIGSIVGYSEISNIINSYADNVTISTQSNSGATVGGIVGKTDSCVVNSCYVKNSSLEGSAINSSAECGGIVGYTNKTTLNNCCAMDSSFFATTASGSDSANSGGLVGSGSGHIDLGKVYNCNIFSENTANSSNEYSSGIIGRISLMCSISNTQVNIASGSNCKNLMLGVSTSGNGLVVSLSGNIYSAGSIAGRTDTISYRARKNSSSRYNRNVNIITSTLLTSTTLDKLGITGNAVINCLNGVNSFSKTFNASSTVDSVVDWLSNTVGLTATLSDGVLSVAGGEGLYINSFDTNLANALNLSNSWYTTDVQDTTVTTTTSTTNTITMTETTTTSITNTIETTETTTTSTTNTIETTETTTTSTTTTETLYTTTTTSETQTETTYVTNTIPATSTTNTVTLTASSVLGDFGLNSEAYITLHVGNTDKIVTIKPTDTAAQFISAIGGINSVTASITDGKFTLTPQSDDVYILGMSNELRNLMRINNSYYTKSYNYANSDSRELKVTTTHNIIGSTALTLAGISGSDSMRIYKADEGFVTLSLSGLTTFNDVINMLHTYGIEMTITDGNVVSVGDRNSYIVAGGNKVLNALKLGSVNYDYVNKQINDKTRRIKYSYSVENENPAPETINLQVGINGDEYSKIRIRLGLTCDSLNYLRNIGYDNDPDLFDKIDALIKAVQLKQSEVGAMQNRVESVIEQIGIQYDNLVSSRSTLKDADITKVSSDYIRNQILQQAAATLLSTANQTSQIALGLI